ncbi:MAG: hypothetical protein QS721_05540 [Candidatus Endonucleobacter sp. (ex Gigantidas childressi)]|nr:hypothetical protein [Candidatus Endonucleobacter sp. (ex Gigantidas childressi)]
MEDVSSLAKKLKTHLPLQLEILWVYRPRIVRLLRQNKLSCRIRVKSNNLVEHRSKKIAIGKLCRGVSINQTVTWHSKKKVSGVPLYIAARRTLKGLSIVVATKKSDSIIDDYSQRWSIKTMFVNLKSRGFDLESTHMTNLDRMDKLMGLMTIAVVWCILVGHWCNGNANQLPLNKHYHPAKILFRLGLDWYSKKAVQKMIKPLF